MKKYILFFLLTFQIVFSQAILVKGKAFNSGKFNQCIVDIFKNDKLITRTDSIGNFEIYAKLSDSLFFQSLYHTTKKFLVADLVKKKKINIKLKLEPCEVWPSHSEKPTKLYVFIGKKIKTWASPSSYCNGIPLDFRSIAKYKIIKNIYGNYNKKTIQFTSYIHSSPKRQFHIPLKTHFSDYEYCIFYVLQYEGELIKIKYLFDDVYMTKEGKWASPIKPKGLFHSISLDIIKPTKINFMTPIEFTYENEFEKLIKEKFPETYTKISDGKISVEYGYYLEDLFEIRKAVHLKEYDYLLNE
jgi:hypothetical protein